MLDPRPRPALRLPNREYLDLVAEVLALAEYRCECGCGRRAASAHHFVPRDRGGDDVLENLVALAGDGTRLCHGAIEGNVVVVPETGERLEPAAVKLRLRQRLEQERPEVLAYARDRMGGWWLERAYPGGQDDGEATPAPW